ncbi:MAG: transmembrane protein [Methanosaeta sp. NSM2]|nr:TMEM165/GDT1 family protein [Methanothrix sp.]OYV11655.1 MAG: transmembrane protein [Methanosaeta sp. NSM2]
MDDILIPLLAVGLAEMGDKTQLSILLLSSRTQEYARLVLGVMLAFLLADGLAILVGSYIDAVVPVTTVKALSGLVFILFGILILKEKGEEEESEQSLSARGAFLSGFSMIFLSEWGDKTQIASALFATEYDPLLVLAGVMIALFILTLMAIFLGRYLSRRIDRKLMSRVAGGIFLLIGFSFLISALASSAW